MRLKVKVAAVGFSANPEDVIDLYCGNGDQILQWVGYAACARLTYKAGEVQGCYVPQSINSKDGEPLDIDIVINEYLNDGDELLVEYSSGPQAYRIRWEGRPRTPPFRWGEDKEILPPHDAWLHDLDLRHEGCVGLVQGQQDNAAIDKELNNTRKALQRFAGALQMIFLYHECEGQKSPDQLGHLTLPQFRNIMVAAKVVSFKYPAERVDEIFTMVVTSDSSISRKRANASSGTPFDIMDFFVAMVHVAYHRYMAEYPDITTPITLPAKFVSLMQECFGIFHFPELQKKLERFNAALTPAASMILKKGRRLTEQTLHTCQLKRVKATVIKVELKYVCSHMIRWSLLQREFTFQELAMFIIFGKQSHMDPHNFVLQPVPLDLTYDEFEKMLLALAYHMYGQKKKHDPFEEYLGEMLDFIYKKANVLVAKDDAE